MTRAQELERIEGLARAADGGRSGGLVLVGEPGAGKSWLCERAVERARGFRVVATRGVRSESQLGYAGLFDVMSPLVEGGLDRLAPPRAQALRVALRLEGPAVVDRLAVAVACLDVLAAAAEVQPLLIVVDDAHWVDHASLDALRFAGRRLDADRVGLLLALRPEGEASFAQSGFDVLRIGGLAEADAVAALEAFASLPVNRSVARRVIAASAGNPLALSEAARSLSAHQLAGRAELPTGLPQPASLQFDYEARASTLPAGTRQALTLLAVGEAAGAAVFERAMSEHATAVEAFAPAVEAGLVRLDAGRPRFLHPLTQAAAWHGADPQERRTAHRALATAWTAADDHERAAWHLADAADGPDAAAALALAGVAHAARARGAPQEAAQAWRRAAELEADASETMRLGFEEACDLARAGRAAPLLDHVARMLDAEPPAPLRADLELLRGNMLLWVGRIQEAASLLERAAADIRSGDPGRAAALLCGAAFAHAMRGDIRGAVKWATAALGLAEDVGGGAVAAAQVTLAWSLILAGEAPRGYPLLLRWIGEAPSGLVGPGAGARFGQLTCWMEDYGTARRELEGSIARARAQGCASELPHAMGALAEVEFRHGQWTGARRLADEAVRLATDIGLDFPWARVHLAQLDAVTGDADGVRAHVAVILDTAHRTGSRSLEIYASAALGLLELGLDAPGRAAEHLERTRALVEETGLGEPNVVQWRADLIESKCRAGRAADAARSLATFEHEASATGRRWALGAAARCRALLAPAADIDGAFAEAHRLVADDPSSFELARTELCWGERLRREHRRVEARRHLDEALRRFEALGAAPWAEKAARELRSSGARARRGPKQPTGALTAAESQIAALVAEGQTNKDIAAALFLSPKTVEFHLGHVFRKLGIHNRTQLARALLLEG